MATELLLEVPSRVVKVFPLKQGAAQVPYLKCPLVLVQTDSVSVAHGENGSLYHHYDFGRKTNYGAIVDCVYLHNRRCFLVAFGDCLVVAPIDTKNVSQCQRVLWPVQALFTDGTTATICGLGFVCLVSDAFLYVVP